MATVLVDQLVRAGVTDAVLAPGSRDAPLSYALHAADQAGRLRLHVRIDERTAGFLALGLAKAAERPVPVVTTSGTAAANLHPAILEAAHSGVPLVAMTADRPAQFRGTGANQTTDQVKLYGTSVRWFADLPAPGGRPGEVAFWRNIVMRALASALGRDPGPVHLNVPLVEPLVPDGDPAWPEPLEATAGETVLESNWTPVPVPIAVDARTVVVAGDADSGAGCAARRLAEDAGWPLFAEPSSGARSGNNAIGPYRLLLDGSLGSAIERVVVYGRPTLSRPVQRLLARADVEVVVVSAGPHWTDPSRRAARVVSALVLAGAAGADRDWLGRWKDASTAATAVIDRILDTQLCLTGPAVARAVAAALPQRALLVVGASNPIRDLDLAAAPWPGDGVRVIANRGLAGIDGTVSTAVGAALGSPGVPAYAFIGDLTFLHDSNGLVLGPDEPRPDLCIVVVNDDGGGIFSTLEQGAPEVSGTFERVFGTPHGIDLAALSRASGTRHQQVDSIDQLVAALQPAAGLRVVEVAIDRSGHRPLHESIRAAVAST